MLVFSVFQVLLSFFLCFLLCLSKSSWFFPNLMIWKLGFANLNSVITTSISIIIIIITVLWYMDLHILQHMLGSQKAARRSLFFHSTLGHMPKVLSHDKPSARPRHWTFNLDSMRWVWIPVADFIIFSMSPLQAVSFGCIMCSWFYSVLEVNWALQVRLTWWWSRS